MFAVIGENAVTRFYIMVLSVALLWSVAACSISTYQEFGVYFNAFFIKTKVRNTNLLNGYGTEINNDKCNYAWL